MLYDADILEEKVLLEWGVKVSKKYVSRELSQEIHAKAEPFITWLREAEEEEESSEDEEEDDLEVSNICDRKVQYKDCQLFSSKGKSRNLTQNLELITASFVCFFTSKALIRLHQDWYSRNQDFTQNHIHRILVVPVCIHYNILYVFSLFRSCLLTLL